MKNFRKHFVGRNTNIKELTPLIGKTCDLLTTFNGEIWIPDVKIVAVRIETGMAGKFWHTSKNVGYVRISRNKVDFFKDIDENSTEDEITRATNLQFFRGGREKEWVPSDTVTNIRPTINKEKRFLTRPSNRMPLTVITYKIPWNLLEKGIKE